jgi:hypothetical protein
MRKLVIIESPLAGDFERNIRYARHCLYDSIVNHNEAPFASHLLYPQCLDDENPAHRAAGMEAGFDWALAADYRVVYTDLGISEGMRKAIEESYRAGYHGIIYRELPPPQLALFEAGIPAGYPTRGATK